MRTAFVTLLFAASLCAAAIFLREHGTEREAERALASREPIRAFELYGQLRTLRPWFLDRSEIDARFEAAAAAALPLAEAHHDFTLAAKLAATILTVSRNSVNPGYMTGANAAVARLPDEHLRWIADLLDQGHIDDALRECGAARGLYAERPWALDRLRALDARGVIARAERALASGDPELVVRTVAALDPAAPIPLQVRAVKAVRGASAARAQWQIANRDFPGLLRGFDATLEIVSERSALVRAVELEFAELARRVFEMPATEAIDTLDVDDLPPPTAVGPSPGSGVARLSILNHTGRPLTVYLRGAHDYKVVIDPGRTARLDVRSGEYAEAAFDNGSKTVPYLGVIQLPAADHLQAFAIGQRRARQGAAPRRKPLAPPTRSVALN